MTQSRCRLLLFFPLNEPFAAVVNAGKTPWKSKLNRRRTIKKLDYVYPSGLLSIAAYAKARLPELDIRILDGNVVMGQLADEHPEQVPELSLEQYFVACRAAVADFRPDLIGISTLFCSNYSDLRELVAFWRRSVPEAVMVGGGHLTAAVFQRAFADRIDFDAICGGEGEIPMAELCQAWMEGRHQAYLAESKVWATPSKLAADPSFQPARKLLDNLDDIPPYDFSLLVHQDVYFNSSRYFFIIESDESLREMFIFSTRGCPYHCVFCASQNVHGHQVRSYSVERIRQDILHYHRAFGISRFIFYDDHFLVDKPRAIAILDFVAEQGLRAEIPTPAFFSLDDDVAAAMARAGIREVNITIESGNPDTLRHIMHKPGTLEMAGRAVAALHRAGILAVSNILIGLPGETPDSIEQGVQYLLTTDINWFQCFVAAPLPGSRMWDVCEENHYFTEPDPMVMDFKRCVIRTPDFTPEYIEHKVYEMNLRLNFIHNYDMRIGNYAGALRIFERILTTVIDTHAFAYYFAARCCLALGLGEQYARYKSGYEAMVATYSFWQAWVREFNLPPLPGVPAGFPARIQEAE